jgi:diguanylate cyclase (GGDEF)-like protein
LFEDRLTQALALAQRDRQTLSILFLSLDRFKKVNDTLGHAPGHRLLREVAGRLTNCIREGETVARFEGDEFALLTPAVQMMLARLSIRSTKRWDCRSLSTIMNSFSRSASASPFILTMVKMPTPC